MKEERPISEKLIGPSYSPILQRTVEIVKVDAPAEFDSDDVASPVITRKMSGPNYAPIPEVTIDYPTANHRPNGDSSAHFARS